MGSVSGSFWLNKHLPQEEKKKKREIHNSWQDMLRETKKCRMFFLFFLKIKIRLWSFISPPQPLCIIVQSFDTFQLTYKEPKALFHGCSLRRSTISNQVVKIGDFSRLEHHHLSWKSQHTWLSPFAGAEVAQCGACALELQFVGLYRWPYVNVHNYTEKPSAAELGGKPGDFCFL